MMTRMRFTGLLLLLAGGLPLSGLAQETPRDFQQFGGGWIGISVDFTNVVLEGRERNVAVISQIVPGSPADMAGIRVGDNLVRLDGQPVSERILATLPWTIKPGDLVRFTIHREGRSRDLLVEAAPRPDSMKAMTPSLRPEFNFPTPDLAFPFTSFAVRTPSADSLQVQIQRLRQEVTEVRRQQLSRQRELQASMGRSAEEAIQRDGRLAALLTREETLLAQQRSLTERLRRVSEEEIQLQWAEAQSRYEEALSRMLGNEREAQRRGAREREETTSRPAEVYVYARGGSGSPIIAGQSAMLGAHLAPLNPDLAALFSVPEGVFVIQVPEGTPAADAGLLGGDIIVRIGDEKVASLTDLRFGLGVRGQSLRMQVIRRGQPVEIVVRR